MKTTKTEKLELIQSVCGMFWLFAGKRNFSSIDRIFRILPAGNLEPCRFAVDSAGPYQESAKRFQWHYTPKHGRWLDMTEIEIGVLSLQALLKPLPDLESFRQQVHDWTIRLK